LVFRFNRLKREYKLTKAFKNLFYEKGKLKPDAELVLSFLREECGAKGELGRRGSPYFYDRNEKFDVNAAAFLLGKRRVFDLIVKHLSLDETQIFRLLSQEEKTIEEDLEI
jgi:hypothetical protein